MADTVILPMALQLLACLEQELLANPDPPAEVRLLAGQLTIHDINAEAGTDTTCCPGLAYVRLGDVFPSSEFPNPDGRPGKAGGCLPTAWAAVLTMGVVRCVNGMGSPTGPSEDDWLLAATHDANDVDAMRRALCCWSDGLPATRLWLAGVSSVVLTADCVERQMPVTVSVPRCC